MSLKRYDAIVIGAGAVGSAATYHLARRGAKVLCLEQFGKGHDRGSSHGNSRLHRVAYFEARDYVPLLQRADALWDVLSREMGSELLHRVGLLIMGANRDKGAIAGVLASAAQFGIPVEDLSPEELSRRFPQFSPPAGFRGVLEPRAGFLAVEECVLAHCHLAARSGAEIRENEIVQEWKARGNIVEVTTSLGAFEAERLVIAAGPWSGRVLSGLRLPLRVLRVPQFWFEAPAALSEENGTPCFAFDLDEDFTYGVPARPRMGLKMASYKPPEVEVCDPLTVDRVIRDSDMQSFRFALEHCLPGVNPRPIHSSVCMYTMTPDENFIVDRHPVHANVAFAAGLSGHGFKFSTVLGEILADLTLNGATSHPIDFLRLARFPSTT